MKLQSIVLFSLISLFALSCGDSTTNSSETFAPGPLKLAFMSITSGNHEIITMNPDGSNQETLVSIQDDISGYSISPDGKYLTYDAYDEGNSLYRLNLIDLIDLEDKTLISPRLDSVRDPVFSPDSEKILYIGSKGISTSQFFTIDINGNNEFQVTNLSGTKSDPIWSPDGSTIYFQSRTTGLSSVNSSGDNLFTIFDPANYAFREVCLSTDGEAILFRIRRSDARINVINTDGSNFRELIVSTETTFPSLPMWDPGETKFYYVAGIDEQNSSVEQIKSMNIDGTGEATIFETLSGIIRLKISPDGSRFALLLFNPAMSNYELHMMNSDATDQKIIFTSETSLNRLTWYRSVVRVN